MSRFSKTVVKKLKQAGWYPNRRVDIFKTIELLEKSGCSYTQEMLDFLSEFQGLLLEYKNGEEVFSFELQESWINKVNCINYNSYTFESVYPIGVMDNCNYVVLISELNKMYVFEENTKIAYLIGETFDSGIEFISVHGLNTNIILLEKKHIHG